MNSLIVTTKPRCRKTSGPPPVTPGGQVVGGALHRVFTGQTVTVPAGADLIVVDSLTIERGASVDVRGRIATLPPPPPPTFLSRIRAGRRVVVPVDSTFIAIDQLTLEPGSVLDVRGRAFLLPATATI